MTEKQILLEQFDAIRGWTMALIGDFSEEEAQKVAEPIRTSLVWTLGHLAVIENAVLKLFFNQSLLDENLVPKFKTGSDPSSVGSVTKAEVLKKNDRRPQDPAKQAGKNPPGRFEQKTERKIPLLQKPAGGPLHRLVA
jgi:hypothetical protein